MTRQDQLNVLAAVARWEPIGLSIALEPVDQRSLREAVTLAVAPALRLDGDAALAIVEGIRMSS